MAAEQVGYEVRGLDDVQSQFSIELIGAVAHEHDVRRALHDRARQTHRTLRARDAGHRATASVAAIHDRSVEFRQAVAIEHATDAGIEQRTDLELDDHAFDRVEADRKSTRLNSSH